MILPLTPTIVEAVQLLRRNALAYLGLPALFYAILGGLPLAIPSVSIGLFIGGAVASCFLAMYLYASMIFDLGGSAVLSTQDQIIRSMQSKAMVYLGFSIIFGLAGGFVLSLTGGLVLGLGSTLAPGVIEAFMAGFEANNGMLFNLNSNLSTGTWLGFILWLGLGFLASLAVLNVLTTIWFIAPPLMIAVPQGIAAMGTSAALVRPTFWSVYKVSFAGLLIYTTLSLGASAFIILGSIADTWYNNALAGIFEGIGMAFLFALSAVAWRSLAQDQSLQSVFK